MPQAFRADHVGSLLRPPEVHEWLIAPVSGTRGSAVQEEG